MLYMIRSNKFCERFKNVYQPKGIDKTYGKRQNIGGQHPHCNTNYTYVYSPHGHIL